MGFLVSTPFGGRGGYDFIIDDGEKLLKVECKTGRLYKQNTVLVWNSCSSHGRYSVTKKDYRKRADLFAVFEPTSKKVYLVPVASVGRFEGRLRLQNPKKGKTKLNAEDFVVHAV